MPRICSMVVVSVARPTCKERRPRANRAVSLRWTHCVGQSGARQPRGPSGLSARTANVTAGFHFKENTAPHLPRSLIMNFMRRHCLLVIAHMSGPIERAPEPMSKFFRPEKCLGRTRAACVLPTSPPTGTVQEFRGALLPQAVTRSRIAIGSSDRHGRLVKSLPDYPGERLSDIRDSVAPSRRLPSKARRTDSQAMCLCSVKVSWMLMTL